MKASTEWITYRTRFLVKAKQLSHNLSFTDSLGRQHNGRKGDYLVESDGVLRIAPRKIFEDIYVAIPERVEEAEAEPILNLLPELPRKYPQPCRDRRYLSAGYRFL